MVFLPVAGYDGIAAGGITVHLVLAHHGSGGILGNHETRIQTGIGNQELRQSAQPHDELGNAAFGDITQLGKGDAQKVVRNSQRLPVKVSTRNDAVFIGEDSRIVRYGIDFGQQYRRHIPDGILRGAMHLRNTTERVRILHMLAGTGDEFAAFQQLADVLACLDLSFVGTDLLDTVHEGVDTAVKGFQ